MGRKYEALTESVTKFIDDQPMFFVATAPLAESGHVNLSPKGMDTLRIVDPHTIVYADLAGSAAETIGHLRENGRVTLMWCSFAASPRIVRVHGQGEVLFADHREFDQLAAQFPSFKGLRAMIRIRATRIADSCGYGVPRMDLVGPRDRLVEWADRKSAEELTRYMRDKNSVSIDGLDAWEG